MVPEILNPCIYMEGGQLLTKPIYNFDLKVPLCCSIKHRSRDKFVLKVCYQTVTVVHYYIQKEASGKTGSTPPHFLLAV